MLERKVTGGLTLCYLPSRSIEVFDNLEQLMRVTARHCHL
jgi:hypothetical protein